MNRYKLTLEDTHKQYTEMYAQAIREISMIVESTDMLAGEIVVMMMHPNQYEALTAFEGTKSVNKL